MATQLFLWLQEPYGLPVRTSQGPRLQWPGFVLIYWGGRLGEEPPGLTIFQVTSWSGL